MREIRTSGSMSGDENGALPHGPSYSLILDSTPHDLPTHVNNYFPMAQTVPKAKALGIEVFVLPAATDQVIE